jgi:hypothetical protein
MTAMHEFVVPKSMPKTFAIIQVIGCRDTHSQVLSAMLVPSVVDEHKSRVLLRETKEIQDAAPVVDCAEGDALAQSRRAWRWLGGTPEGSANL